MAMLLKSDDGKEFELALAQDNLGEIQDGHGDSESLTITFRAATNEDSWEETSPCLNTFELQILAEWLEAVASGGNDEPELELLEPELRFVIVKDHGETVTLRIGFHLADRPAEFTMDADTDAAHIDLKLPRDRLRAAVQALKRDLEELGAATTDDLEGEADPGEVRTPDEDLGLVHDEKDYPPGAGEGLDNAGER